MNTLDSDWLLHRRRLYQSRLIELGLTEGQAAYFISVHDDEYIDELLDAIDWIDDPEGPKVDWSNEGF